MLRTIAVFETADGERFDDERKALEHVADMCREAIAKRLKPLMDDGRMTHSEVTRVVLQLIPDATTAQQFADELAHFIGADE